MNEFHVDGACRVWGPTVERSGAEDALARLSAAGVRRRSLAIVDLAPSRGLERDPLVRWALSRITRETFQLVLLSLPLLAMLSAAVFLSVFDDRRALAFGLGVTGAFVASPIVAMIGFALAWRRWGSLAVRRGSTPPRGHLVVAFARPPRR